MRWLKFSLRFAVSAALIAWLVTRIEVVAALGLLRAARPVVLVAGLLAVLATVLLSSWRWRVCLLGDGGRVSLRTTIVSYWTSLFVGTMLPTEYGGDVLRVKDMWQRLGSGSKAVASVFLSRLSGIGAMMFLFILVGLWRQERVAELSIRWLWAASLAVSAVLAAIVFIRPVSDRVLSLLERLPAFEKLGSGLVRFVSGARAQGTLGAYAWRIAALALVNEVMLLATTYFFALALGQSVRVADLVLVMPLVTLSTVLPISLGGIGVKEGAFVVSLSAIGLSAEAALSVALLNRLAMLGLVMVGGALFPFRQALMERER